MKTNIPIIKIFQLLAIIYLIVLLNAGYHQPALIPRNTQSERNLIRNSCESFRIKYSAAENKGDISQIMAFFHEEIAIQFPGVHPIIGKEAVESFLTLVHTSSSINSSYISNDIYMKGDYVIDTGQSIQTLTPKSGGDDKQDSLFYKIKYSLMADSVIQIIELIFSTQDSPQLEIPTLPGPTGMYKVGVHEMLFEDSTRSETFDFGSDQKRKVAIQVWYPVDPPQDAQPRKYQSKRLVDATAHYYGWPRFLNSFMARMESNSYESVKILVQPHLQYPVLLYNHGYSGFTAVHQSLYEDLASHGYVVVSVGHAYESACFLLAAGDVEVFNPANEELQKRNTEATGTVQEALKDSVMYAENQERRAFWYQKLIAESPYHNESVHLWVADNLFVIEKLSEANEEDSLFHSMLNLDNIGAFGHSLGGATAGQLVISSKRIRAGINYDGFQFGDLLSSELNKPFMFFAADRPWAGGSTISNDVFYEQSNSPCYMVTVEGFQHSTFSDLILFNFNWALGFSADVGLRNIEIQRVYTRAFFDRHLKQIRTEILNSPSEDYPELRIWSRNN